MMVENITGYEKTKSIKESLFFVVSVAGQVNDHLIFLSVLHSFLSVTAVVGNTLILIALYKESSLHPPSKLLYSNLAVTDICVGIILEPLAVTYWIAHLTERWTVWRYALDSNLIISYILCSVSLLTMTAISVDRLLALMLGLRYRHVVTLKRTYASITMFWVVSIVGATMHFLNPVITSWYEKIGISLCLITSAFSYTAIFLTLRHNKIQLDGHVSQKRSSQAIPLNIARYRKAVYSALWVQVTLVVCYLPYGIAVALRPREGYPLPFYLVMKYTVSLVYLNSSLNPLLYCWKIKAVRQAVKETLRHICCIKS